MQTALFLSSVFATLVFFIQAVPAPPFIVGITGVIASGAEQQAKQDKLRKQAKEDAKKKKDEGKGRRSERLDTPWVFCPGYRGCNRKGAVSYALNMAREIASEMKRTEGAGAASEGIPQHNWEECVVEVRKTTVNVTGPIGNSHIRVDGVPPACMVLAKAIGSAGDSFATPVPCGSACIEYTNMTAEVYETVRSMLNTHALNFTKPASSRAQ